MKPSNDELLAEWLKKNKIKKLPMGQSGGDLSVSKMKQKIEQEVEKKNETRTKIRQRFNKEILGKDN